MEGFIGRTEELAELEALYEFKGKRTCAIYGLRRMGKTTLLEAFCEGKRSVYLQMAPGSERQNLDAIQDEMSRIKGVETNYQTFPEFLSDLSTYCSDSKTVVIIDELPFLLEVAPHVAGYLQNFIDHRMKGTETVFIVCGSSVSSMEKETADPTRPLYNRFRFRIYLQPMSLEECSQFHPDMTDADNVRMYLTLGGNPFFHEGMTQSTYKEAVIDGYLKRNAFMRDQAWNTILELKNDERCMAILDAISSGTTSLKGISEQTDIPRVCQLAFIRVARVYVKAMRSTVRGMGREQSRSAGRE